MIAANPFGLHDFQNRPKGAGDMTLPAGGKATFRYRLYLHEGNAESRLSAMQEEFAALPAADKLGYPPAAAASVEAPPRSATR